MIPRALATSIAMAALFAALPIVSSARTGDPSQSAPSEDGITSDPASTAKAAASMDASPCDANAADCKTPEPNSDSADTRSANHGDAGNPKPMDGQLCDPKVDKTCPQ